MNEFELFSLWEEKTLRARRRLVAAPAVVLTLGALVLWSQTLPSADEATAVAVSVSKATAATHPSAGTPTKPTEARSQAGAPGASLAATTAPAEPMRIALRQVLDAELVSLSSPIVQAELSGTVREVRTVPGQRVEAGEVLAVLDATEARLTLAEAQALTAQSQALLAERTRDLARNEELAAKEYVSRVQLQASRTQAQIAHSQLAAARARQAQAERLLDKTTVRAPFAALVLEHKVAPGATVRAGEPLFQLFSAEQTMLVARAPQALFGRVQAGQSAVVRWGEQRLASTVVRVSPVLDGASRSFEVHLAVPPALAGLAGVALTAELEQPGEEYLTIPTQALQLTGDATHVFVLQDGRAWRREIRVHAQEGGRAYVGSGLVAGELVLVEGASFARDGAAVEVSALPAPDGSGRAASAGGGSPAAGAAR